MKGRENPPNYAPLSASVSWGYDESERRNSEKQNKKIIGCKQRDFSTNNSKEKKKATFDVPKRNKFWMQEKENKNTNTTARNGAACGDTAMVAGGREVEKEKEKRVKVQREQRDVCDR